MTHEIDAAETIAALEETLRKANKEVEELLKKLSHRNIQVTKLKADLAHSRAEVESLVSAEIAALKLLRESIDRLTYAVQPEWYKRSYTLEEHMSNNDGGD